MLVIGRFVLSFCPFGHCTVYCLYFYLQFLITSSVRVCIIKLFWYKNKFPQHNTPLSKVQFPLSVVTIVVIYDKLSLSGSWEYWFVGDCFLHCTHRPFGFHLFKLEYVYQNDDSCDLYLHFQYYFLIYKKLVF